MNNSILLTGIPRSGTTLACSLLNQLTNTLALVEPMDMNAFTQAADADARRAFVTRYLQEVRAGVLLQGQVNALVVAGEETNTFASHGSSAKRKTVITGSESRALDKPFAPDFTLIIKHPNAFSALLPELAQVWPCYAIVRNPLAVLASWHSLDHPLAHGRAPMAEAFDPHLRSLLDAQPSDLDRQLVLIDWYFSRYQRYLPAGHMISYEQIVNTGGSALSPLVAAARELAQPLTSRNNNRIYDHRYIYLAAEKLLQRQAHGCAWSDSYDQNQIHALAEAFTASGQIDEK